MNTNPEHKNTRQPPIFFPHVALSQALVQEPARLEGKACGKEHEVGEDASSPPGQKQG